MTTRAAYGCGFSPAILRVTNLNDSGPGSLRDALTASGPRVVIFEVSGNIVLGSAQAFHDHRLFRRADRHDFDLLERVGEQAWKLHDQPDAGMWELRTKARVHTSSSLMCWAACDRLSKAAQVLALPDRAAHWRERADQIRQTILEAAWCEERKAFAAAFGALCLLLANRTPAAPVDTAPAPRTLLSDTDRAIIAEIKARSELMKNLEYLSDRIGGRLTGSANLEKANKWTAEKMKSYGLVNVRLEPWEIPYGWERGRAEMKLIEPDTGRTLMVASRGWAPGTKGKAGFT